LVWKIEFDAGVEKDLKKLGHTAQKKIFNYIKEHLLKVENPRSLGKPLSGRANAFIPGVQDKERYKTRSAIERFFAQLKENKRLIARFDKLDITFFSFIALACLKTLKLLC
jgi:transposase